MRKWLKEKYTWTKTKINGAWKWLIILIFPVALAAVITTQPDDFTTLDNVTSRIIISQDIYFQNNGAYWQGLPTHDVIPLNDKLEKPSFSRKPTDQSRSWEDLVQLPDRMPVSAEVHIYETPIGGHGYQIVYTKRQAGVIYKKSVGVGPEERTYDWTPQIKTPAFQ